MVSRNQSLEIAKNLDNHALGLVQNLDDLHSRNVFANWDVIGRDKFGGDQLWIERHNQQVVDSVVAQNSCVVF